MEGALQKIKIDNKEFEIRKFDKKKDSVSELTELLHRSYKRLADMGLRFVATHQNEEYTEKYMENGECFILTCGDKMIGTIFYYTRNWDDIPEVMKRDDAVLFGKFAVLPEYQNIGLGTKLMDFIESHAVENGKNEIVLDTSDKAQHLIDYYSKRGYKFVQYWQWPDVNYRSVVMIKKLT
ncbi:MAG: GNAT family N-acetyltransferase [Chlorobi bacterium]|nr:GNAT family N-acetyltransferase [Chlorobiota bacterium]MCI0716296.1 GNAT family N-acetyltransferase [Chlorobiota bacterium]